VNTEPSLYRHFAKTKVIATILHLRESPYFALHKGIAIGFVKAIGFRNKPKRTLFYFWCGDPINVRLSAVRKLVGEARRNNLIGSEEAARLTDIPNISQKGTRLGNWLTREQAKELLAVPDRSTLKGKRDYVILALLVGCALRRNELAELDVATIQQREGRWVLADLEGKGRRIRTVAIPIWVKQGINAWMTAAGIEDGRLLRSVSKSGKVKGDTLSDWAVWSVVEQSSKQIGIEHFGAHDLRRTCAKLCRKNGGDLEQIKFLLGHSSIQTTERYLGSEQDIEIAVNDNLGL
jgi:integrase